MGNDVGVSDGFGVGDPGGNIGIKDGVIVGEFVTGFSLMVTLGSPKDVSSEKMRRNC